ncbi:MAG: STAS domain-containing protein [Phycisphaerales bacterium]|nr:STAS domain-containing protein [Phycisphaerales bacterium]
MSTELQPPQWLQERVDGKCLHLTSTKDVLNEPEGRELSEFLRHRLEGDAGEGITAVAMNLSGVALITSPAIGALIVIHKRLATAGRQLILVELAPMLVETLSFLKLDRVFTVCPTTGDLDKVIAGG